MPAIYHEGGWIGNATDPEVLVKDTVGWTGKNKWNPANMSGTNNVGNTWYKNSDGSVTLNGTTTGDFIFPSHEGSIGYDFYDIEGGKTYRFTTETVNANIELQVYCKETSGSSWTRLTSDVTSGNELVFTTPASFYDIWLRFIVRSGKTLNNVTIYPMIRKAAITDPTYEPYHESVEVMYEEEIHGVNLLTLEACFSSVNGVTRTINSDNSVTINGTATNNNNIYFSQRNTKGATTLDVGRYIFSVGESIPSNCRLHLSYSAIDGSNVVVAYGDYGVNTITFDAPIKDRPWNILMEVKKDANFNNLKLYPMIRKADIDDPTYRPYNEQAIQNQLNAQGVLGAKNFIPMPYADTTKTVNGITFTVNSDGSITVNGTATGGYAVFNITPNPDVRLQGLRGHYIASIGKNVIQPNGMAVNIRKSDNNIWGINPEMTNIEIELTDNLHLNGWIYIYVAVNTVVNNVKIYPMLRLASDPDDTYQPYAMTNRELTEKVLLKKALSNVDLNDITEYGIYSIQTGITNRPESVTYATLIVAPGSSFDGSARTQMVYKDQYLYIRSKSGSPATWTNWYKFTGTVVS